MKSDSRLVADVNEQLQQRDWRRRVFGLADAGLPWIPVIGHNVYLRNPRVEPLPMHRHEGCVEVVYLKKGVARYETQEGVVKLKTGMVLVSKPGVLHRRIGIIHGSETYYFLFKMPASSKTLRGLDVAESKCVVDRIASLPSVMACGSDIAARFHRVLALAELGESVERNILIRCEMLSLIFGLRSELIPRTVRSALANNVRKISREMLAHPEFSWSMEELTMRLRTSLPSVVRQFKEETGFTPHSYLMRCRVTHAERCLSEGSLSLSAAAAKLGFSSVQHMIRVFKSVVGIPPGAWLAARRKAVYKNKVL